MLRIVRLFDIDVDSVRLAVDPLECGNAVMPFDIRAERRFDRIDLAPGTETREKVRGFRIVVIGHFLQCASLDVIEQLAIVMLMHAPKVGRPAAWRKRLTPVSKALSAP
jgi:hypothetical protein